MLIRVVLQYLSQDLLLSEMPAPPPPHQRDDAAQGGEQDNTSGPGTGNPQQNAMSADGAADFCVKKFVQKAEARTLSKEQLEELGDKQRGGGRYGC